MAICLGICFPCTFYVPKAFVSISRYNPIHAVVNVPLYIPYHKLMFDTSDSSLTDTLKEWCEEHEMDVEDTDYCEGDDYFECGREEHGVCIFTIYEVPALTNEADQALWDAKLEMDNARYAATDYAWSLTDCVVSEHTEKAKGLIDKAMELMGGWKGE